MLARIHYDPWNLMGPANKDQRQALMLFISGRMLPKAKCGVTALSAALDARYGHAKRCVANHPEDLKQALTEALNQNR